MIQVKTITSVADLIDLIPQVDKQAGATKFSGSFSATVQYKRGTLQVVRVSAEATGVPEGRLNT